MTEQWKTIEGFSSYLISSLGRVYSIRNKIMLKPTRGGGFNGPTYMKVELNQNGKRKRFYIHRLVASHFLDNPENKPEVDHLDRNTMNNCVGNLRWATRLENRKNRSK